MFTFPEPPYFLLVVGLFFGLASGVAFEATLKQQVQEWVKSRSTRTLAQMQGVQLLVPFVGIVLGISIFLVAGLEIFGFPMWLSYALSLPMTILIAVLVWSQLGQLLLQLEQGGSKALDLDSFN
ncbi:MAG: hypothetical protein KME06_06735 [Kastovskya adunca ATA6-11-RM4]|nr:hypothetical protein [Kastovskya adunca ATA6-11-RM4]